MNYRVGGHQTRFPVAEERQLLRAALLEGSPAIDAWCSFRADHGGIDHLDGGALALLPQLYCNLKDLDRDDRELGRLKGIYRRAWYANQILLHAAAQAISALQAGGIKVMLIGGGALVALPIGDVGARPIECIQLLVSYRDRRRALALLRKLGWAGQTPSSASARLRAQVHVPLVRGTVERLSLNCSTVFIGARSPGLWADAATVIVRGTETLVPSPTDQLLLACAPGRTWKPGPLRWIPDAALIIRSAPHGLDRHRLAARAGALHAASALAPALAFLSAEFGLEIPVRPSVAPAATARGADRAPGRLDVSRIEAFRRLALDNAVAEVVPALEARGIQPLLIKGPAFARWLYDDPRDRPYGDIDLLVDPDQFAAAERALAELGFEATADALRSRERHHERWVRPGTLPVTIELHHTPFLLRDSARSLVWQRLSAGAQTIEVGGGRVCVPSEPAAAMIVSLHAAQHGRSESQTMRDLSRALERVPPPIWRAAASLADELRAGPAFAAGLQLDDAGRELSRALGLSPSVPRHLQLLTAGPTAPALGIELLLTTPGVRARVSLLAARLAPSPQFMRATSPLARLGSLGLVAAYLWRPFQLLAGLPGGLRQWSRAAAAARHVSGSTKL